ILVHTKVVRKPKVAETADHVEPGVAAAAEIAAEQRVGTQQTRGSRVSRDAAGQKPRKGDQLGIRLASNRVEYRPGQDRAAGRTGCKAGSLARQPEKITFDAKLVAVVEPAAQRETKARA